MTAEQAATQLDSKLRGYPWYISTGVGAADTIYLYVKSSRHRELNFLRGGWLGYQVVIRSTGSVSALNSHLQALAR